MNIFSRIKMIIIDLFFPYVCYGCGVEGSLLCQACKAKLRWIHPACFVCKKFSPGHDRIPMGRTCRSCRSATSIYGFLSPFDYDDPLIRDAIHSLKYERVRGTASVLGALCADYLRYFHISFPSGARIIPIPLHLSRKRVRGFNQSELIAQHFIEALGVPDIHIADTALARIKKTVPQIALSREERMHNMEGAFQVVDPDAVRGATVILLDDVATTGATIEEAARVLKEAGAGRVWAITIAH